MVKSPFITGKDRIWRGSDSSHVALIAILYAV